MAFPAIVMLSPALAAALNATAPDVLHKADAYDALVIGAGAAGGLAAMLLAEAGLRILVLEAGQARPGVGRPRGQWDPGVLEFLRQRQRVQSLCYAWRYDPDSFVDDLDCPYATPPDRPFVWVRSRQMGGRMAVPGHGRQYYRLAPDDFSRGHESSRAWPLSAADLDAWYGFVERRLGLAGMRDEVPWLPDSELKDTLSLTPAEAELKAAITARWPGARRVLGRFAETIDALEAAAQTGHLLIRTGAIVREIEVDGSGHVRGAIWIDQHSRREERVHAQLIFLCASALESTRLLLLSRSSRSPDGLGASSGVLGRYLMDHIMTSVQGWVPPLAETERPAPGRCFYLPRFDARELSVPPPVPGFSIQLYREPVGADRWLFHAASFAEMPPRPENRIALHPGLRDAWGIPALFIDCAHSERDIARTRDQIIALQQVAKVAGATLSAINKSPAPPGLAIHECGTARMGNEPANSVLDPYNQCWEARGLYVTDGACFPSQGRHNPTLTIFALTARACDHALRTAGSKGLPRNIGTHE